MSEHFCVTAPDGVELGITIFATSDATGINTEIKLDGLTELRPFVDDRDPSVLLTRLLPDFATDWRLMTVDEMTEYKKEKKEEERAKRESSFYEEEL